MDNNTFAAVAPSSAAVASLPPILIADDDPDDLFFAMHLVKRTGTKHPVMTFDGGTSVSEYITRAWLKQAQGQSRLLPRLLFLDLKMAGLDGFSFLQWISKHPDLSAIHVVVLSGSDEPEDVKRAKELGAKRYLAKHPSVSTFARIIAHIYGDSAIATDSLPQEHAENGFFTGRVIESGGTLATNSVGRRGARYAQQEAMRHPEPKERHEKGGSPTEEVRHEKA